MLVVVGLGNIGKEYESTFHNAGFSALDKISNIFNVKINKNECNSNLVKFNFNGEQILFVKPKTYMNNSGDAVLSVVKKYDVALQDLLVLVDDVSIPAGTIRIRKKGSSGNQKGLKDILTKLNTEDIVRIRIGIGPKPEYLNMSDFVLSKYGKNSPVIQGIEKCAYAVEDYINDRNIDKISQKYNGNTIND